MSPPKYALRFKDGGSPDDQPPSKSQQRADLRHDHEWFACDHPERPLERGLTVFHDCCRACRIAAEAARLSEYVLTTMDERLERFGEAPS